MAKSTINQAPWLAVLDFSLVALIRPEPGRAAQVAIRPEHCPGSNLQMNANSTTHLWSPTYCLKVI